jgi:hypothetical protein
MRLAAVFALALAAAPAVAQQAPQREIDPEFAVPAPGLGENYRDQPFVFDLLLRMKPPEEGDRVLFRKQEHRTICAAEMNQSLRLEGLAKKAVQVYRDCAERLAEAERNGKVISPPPVDDHPLKDKQ